MIFKRQRKFNTGIRSEEKVTEQSSSTVNKVKFKNTVSAISIIKSTISNKIGKGRGRRIIILTANKKIQFYLFSLYNSNKISPY
jgi:hypothetical protein